MKMEDIAISITGYSYSNIKETIPDGVDKEEIAAVYEEIMPSGWLVSQEL